MNALSQLVKDIKDVNNKVVIDFTNSEYIMKLFKSLIDNLPSDRYF